ncbi:MAG TPA: heparinase II/III family protein, partial [Sedimentisphaerales bacterium]|nr:heparinase II/III family protein [Sedimentisphaerales bacterium]
DRNERRRYDRMTDSHNTVCIDDVDSSEVWHVFRVGRRARPCDVSVQFSADRARCQAGHHGYDHLRGQPRHIRALDVSDDGAVIVTDQVSGEGCHRVRGGFTLAPQWEARPIACGWELSGNGECIELRVSSSSTPALSVERVPYHPEYGLELETNRVVWRYEGKLPLQVCFAVTGR